MRLANDKLKSDLLQAAKKEFLSHGFLGAQLRDIAAQAGVTTGAIYKYYRGKEDLFGELVAQPARELEQRYREIQQSFAQLPLEEALTNLPEISDDGQMWMMEYLYDHFDAFKLIACCSEGTKYVSYIDVLTQVEVDASIALISKMEEAGMHIHQIDEELVHIVANSLFSGMFETIRHDMPREKAFGYMVSLRDFYSAGWFKILGMPPR